jgi:hypothetical protein
VLVCNNLEVNNTINLLYKALFMNWIFKLYFILLSIIEFMNHSEDVNTKNVSKTSTSDIFIVEINVVTSIHDLVLDNGSCAHIYLNMQALNNRRKLLNKEIQL